MESTDKRLGEDLTELGRAAYEEYAIGLESDFRAGITWLLKGAHPSDAAVVRRLIRNKMLSTP